MSPDFWVVETHILDYTGLSTSFAPYIKFEAVFESPLQLQEARNPRTAFYLVYTVLKHHLTFILKNRYTLDRYEAHLKHEEEGLHPKAAVMMKCYMHEHRYSFAKIVREKFREWKSNQKNKV